ncbi:hypothetical protein PGT21_007858 [Puccinia graminis f. sp. tritici]|uniref:Uncharacterized protein n=1 Tax=Puccinia graminis f. sp. tritici TaxID=56615 RepID=A0A5B0N5Q8_PUCGR|nr:hypothetical protein PGT21_007858 [Puccinia graminis f. sp. tritici]
MSRTASEASTSSLTNAVLRNFNGFLDFVLEFWLATRLSCNNRLNHKSQCLVWICRPPNGCGATQLQSKYLCRQVQFLSTSAPEILTVISSVSRPTPRFGKTTSIFHLDSQQGRLNDPRLSFHRSVVKHLRLHRMLTAQCRLFRTLQITIDYLAESIGAKGQPENRG